MQEIFAVAAGFAGWFLSMAGPISARMWEAGNWLVVVGGYRVETRHALSLQNIICLFPTDSLWLD